VSWDLSLEWKVETRDPSQAGRVGILPIAGSGSKLVTVDGDDAGWSRIVLRDGADGGVFHASTSFIYGDSRTGGITTPGAGLDPILAWRDTDFILNVASVFDGETTSLDPGVYTTSGAGFRDLDRDGTSEVVYDEAAMALDGTLVSTYPNLEIGANNTVVADLDGDGQLEVANPGGLWNARTGEGFAWPMTLAEDPEGVYDYVVVAHEGEVLLGMVSWRTFLLSDLEGHVHWTFFTGLSNGGSPPAAGDADGDGEPEFCVSGTDALYLLSVDGDGGESAGAAWLVTYASLF